MNQKKIALVTGGTGGIGTAICRHLAKDGYRVVAAYYGGGKHDRAQRWQSDQQGQGYDIAIRYADIRDWESCSRLVADIEENIGPVGILVNCAGITRDSSLRKLSPDDWRAVMDTNLTGVFNVTRNVIDGMVERGFGRIVNISSINAEKGQFGQTNYSAAKAGMHGFTKALALEVASKGVTVNTISPGYIETEMLLKMIPEVREKVRQQIPVGRFGRPDEVARLVAFLVADESGFITGANFSINGGHYMR